MAPAAPASYGRRVFTDADGGHDGHDRDVGVIVDEVGNRSDGVVAAGAQCNGGATAARPPGTRLASSTVANPASDRMAEIPRRHVGPLLTTATRFGILPERSDSPLAGSCQLGGR